MNNMVDKIFARPGDSMKTIAKWLSKFFLIAAIILFIVGSFMVVYAVDENYVTLGDVLSLTDVDVALNGDEWVVNGYIGKLLCRDAFVSCALLLCTIPLYAFGILVNDVAEIKKALVDKENKDNTVKSSESE